VRQNAGVPAIALLAVILAGAGPAVAEARQDTLPEFVATLRRAVTANQRTAVAGLMRYPLEVRAGGLRIPVRDAAAFIALYDTIVTPAFKDVVAGARVPASGTAPGLRRTPDGGIVIRDMVTIARRGDAFAVTAITVPMGAPDGAAPGGRSAPRSLTFRVGRPTQVSGTLVPGARDAYRFYAQQGAFVEARLSGIPGRTVLLRLVNDATGAAIDARADAGTRVWTGRVAAGATYRVELVRQPDTGAEPLIYTLSVTLR
jgi:hypothetical protein